ncbi:hypothetical protein T440DRAFT_78458 [Plenodomus tracheiphilus IPT5]|uniref:Uncharacterized protein n=1 Tax=Plenodomus tracheiphilus IPT5 TaxID=1408161 RepID=A0A6A7B6J8_9PLEO|nr:hypothetical protein T440DRAFT_78458 [Plenodomus tracheiphilus IPT5]
MFFLDYPLGCCVHGVAFSFHVRVLFVFLVDSGYLLVGFSAWACIRYLHKGNWARSAYASLAIGTGACSHRLGSRISPRGFLESLATGCNVAWRSFGLAQNRIRDSISVRRPQRREVGRGAQALG